MILPALVKEQKGGALNPPIIRSFDPFLELFRYNCSVFFTQEVHFLIITTLKVQVNQKDLFH